ncbi:MAG: PIN domain-containing protein [Mesorhizobium sp.]|uniref:type II toxin-antitoxin system VapC family toxin n=1 Tax=Mesorhizobium sp. TaxID=1871066 RepID=UPI000FEA37C3|nr:type II toxin-antitoxin system VapC family toxin [Mesorhizobium sp.]RWB77182.1 MAG: PIN domain-containing protein [Mesorhizobium sp.]RWL77793.1 MAG: PIN domain-containing protein [Mesorhizobium sp.]RWL87854.1 MAG: PIN domain-containing protein [Mesorhizobium sp.]RWL92199.1 MAG: PIN domain-containing protein [Mesorhizobium sp.]RWL96746.1 MAG: PIN domain-containing protein [Mesorhizobium sp.]
MPGILLDTHVLYWLVSGAEPLSNDALVTIGENQDAGTLFVSPITAWELAIAARKPPHKAPPDLGANTPASWFSAAIEATAAKIIPIKQRIATEAAAVVTMTGHKDPGDCYLIATARIRNIPIMTRDHVMRGLAAPQYLQIVDC